jgi:predicted nucleic acid-binding protein
MEEAKQIMDKIDPDDTPFIALALAIENDGVWSNDKHFGQQNRVKIWKTDVLLRLLEENYTS